MSPRSNIDELRDLVEPGLAQDASAARDARIGVGRPLRSVRFGIDAHGAELVDPERPAGVQDPAPAGGAAQIAAAFAAAAVDPDAVLRVEHRAGRVELDDGCHEEQHGRERGEAERCDGDIDSAAKLGVRGVDDVLELRRDGFDFAIRGRAGYGGRWNRKYIACG
jgi:hypothetical protein